MSGKVTFWTTKPDIESDASIGYLGRRAWRWVLQLYWSKRAITFGCYREVSFLDREATWRPMADHFAIVLTPKWEWGPEHYWHDGYNCAYMLGFLWLGWGYWHCEKCLPSDGATCAIKGQ